MLRAQASFSYKVADDLVDELLVQCVRSMPAMQHTTADKQEKETVHAPLIKKCSMTPLLVSITVDKQMVFVDRPWGVVDRGSTIPWRSLLMGSTA